MATKQAGHAGRYAPWSFMLAAMAMALTVASYAELSIRFPVSAGEAAYMRAVFGSRLASTLVGLLTVLVGVVTPGAHLRVPFWVPVLGLATCGGRIATALMD